MVHLLLVPYDSGHRGVRMGRGPEHLARHGAAERLRRASCEVRETVVEPASSWRAEIATAFELHRALAGTVKATVEAGGFPLIFSGNCNNAIGIMAVLPENTGVVWLDAHSDFATPETTESGFLDGMGLAILTGRCFTRLAGTVPGFVPVPGEQVLTVGMRSFSSAEVESLDASGVVRVGVPQVRGGGLDEQLEALRSRVERVYVHLDLDVLDPSIAPANYAAVAGGLQPDELFEVLRSIKRHFRVLAATLASYDPDYDVEGRLREVGLHATQVLTEGVR